MESLVEYIIPLIIAGIYFFSNMLAKKSRQDEPEPTVWEVPGADDYEPVYHEETIYEDSAPGEELTAYDRRQLERRQAAQDHREQREAFRSGELPPARTQAAPPPLPESASKSFFDSKMEQQLEQIEATKRQAQQIRAQAGETAGGAQSARRKKSRSRFSGPVRSQLRNPGAAKAAFIYGEIFGPPVSSENQAKIPGLS